MYGKFANVYDYVMNEIPYDDWYEKLFEYLQQHGKEKGRICDLGCGTGIMTEKFAKAGYEMLGVDSSVDMLAQAYQRKEKNNSSVIYLHQDMCNLELDEPVDAFISVCDSINYLLQEEELNALFCGVKRYLKSGGYFIFDLKTVYCYRNVIGNQTWVEQDDNVSYIWENYFYEDQDINEYMLTIFKKQQSGELYERFEETHYQRAYSVDTLRQLLEEAGLELVQSFDEDMKSPVNANSERIYIVARNGGTREDDK